MMPALEKKTLPKILVVDDDPNEMRSLVIGLKLEGFDAVGVANGTDALTALNGASFRAAIIDLMMPEMNGLQLARAVRSAFPSVTTMLMSAYHLSPVQLVRADTGVVGFIPKPFCFDELVRFIQIKINPGMPIRKILSTSASNAGLHAPIDVTQAAAEID
jgi:DNA-binding response OmpR family regulator